MFTQEQGIFSRLDTAIGKFYTYPEELDYMYRVVGPQIYWRQGLSVEVGVVLCTLTESGGSETTPFLEDVGAKTELSSG